MTMKSGFLKSLPLIVAFLMLITCLGPASADSMLRVQYNNPGLVVDLGVGLWAWPMPVDWDDDGDLDLVVSCPDVPFNGTYLFENPGGNAKMPVFKPPVRMGPGHKNIRVPRRWHAAYLDAGRRMGRFYGQGSFFESQNQR